MAITPSRTFDPNMQEFPAPRDARCPFDPPSDHLGSHGTARKVRIWNGTTPWLVSSYADVRSLLADKRISSKPRLEDGRVHPGFPFFSEAFREDQKAGRPLDMFSLDDPEHARLRRMVTGAFALKPVESMRPVIQHIVNERIDAILAGPQPVDLVTELALPVSSLTICELLGVPYGDHLFFQEKTETSTSRSASPGSVLDALNSLREYMDGLIEVKLANPDDGLMSRLVNERFVAGDISREEVVEMGVLLLGAGHATTANMIALGTAALLENPDQFSALRQMDDQKQVAAAVEELLRYLSIIHRGLQRVALEDIEISGITIRAGDGVILALDAANRDETVFPAPAKLDLHRDARQHVAFGFGVHQCIGAPLARVELQTLFTTLARRIPTLKAVRATHDLDFKHDQTAFGVVSLPVSW